MDEIGDILKTEYGITATEISLTPGGWSALAYKAESAQGTYFLKAYDNKRSSTTTLLKKLNLSMKVASWLENNTNLKGKINAPILTKKGEVKAETEAGTYLLFSYIDGETIKTKPLTTQQQEELAEITGELHRNGTNMPFDFSEIKETYEIPCAELLKNPFETNEISCIHQNQDMLKRAIELAYKLADRIKQKQPPFVLCHTDIHGWNLMQSDRLILIDWESIKLAPCEADLFTFWGDWHWGDSNWGSYWDTFLPIYQKLHPEHIPQEENLRFYQIRRHIEDVEEFYKQYLYDGMNVEETREVISCMERECSFLEKLLKN